MPNTLQIKLMDKYLVSKVLFTTPKNGTKEYAIEEFIQIDPATKVSMTIGENKFEYFNKDNEPIPDIKALLSIARQRRAYLDDKGIMY